jgi:hypothetical protein
MELDLVLGSWPRRVLSSLALGVVLIGCGYAVTHGYTSILVGLAALVVLVALAIGQRGAYMGLMLVAAMDGVPFIDTANPVASHITGQDVAILGLVIGAMAWPLIDRGTAPQTPMRRWLALCGALLLAWWVYTVLRTSGNGDASTFAAGDYGRDFGFFGLLIIVLPRVRLTRREIESLLGVLMVAVCLFAAGQIIVVLGFGNPTWLVHSSSEAVDATFGLTRLYSGMNDLVLAALAASIGIVLLARTARARRLATPVAALLLVSFVLELTRSRWVGLVVALLVVTVTVVSRSDPSVSTVLRRRLGALAAALTAGAVIAVLTAPHAILEGSVTRRALSLFTDLQSSTSTIAQRESLISMLSSMLSGHWVNGLGFIPPSAHYFGGLPQGSLRNSDIGVFNAIATMGVVGAVLVYLPVVVVLLFLLGRAVRAWGAAYPWLRYSAAIWIVATLISSGSITTLFSLSGLAMTAVILTLAVHPSVSGGVPQRERDASTDS